MSQLPRYGGQGPKNVTSTTTRTTRIPGTNTTVTQSRTVVTEVVPCETQPQVRARAQGGLPGPGASGVRQPSGIRAPRSAQPGPSRPQPCVSTTCPSGGPRAPKPTGLPQVRLEGLPRATSALPAPGQRPAVQQMRAGGLQPPQASGMQRSTGLQQPRPSGLQQPRPTAVQQPRPPAIQQPRPPVIQQPRPPVIQQPRPTAVQQPRPPAIQQPRPPVIQQPRPPALQQPRPIGLQQPQPSGIRRPSPSGLQRPTPSGLRRPTPTGEARSITPQMPAGRPIKVRSGDRQLQTPEEQSQRPAVCGGPCSFPSRLTDSMVVQPPTPVRGPSPRAIIPPQTPDHVHPPPGIPSAPQKRTERPTGSAAYKMQMYGPKYTLQRPKAPGLIPPSGFQRRPRPSTEERVSRSLLDKSLTLAGEKVTARAASISPCPKRYMDTPEGVMEVEKEAVLEKRIERDEEGEKIVKNLQLVDMGADGGAPKMIEMNIQQLDPKYALPEGKEVISVTSKVSVSESYSTVTHKVSRATTEPVVASASMPPEEVAKLVEEENEDVDNTLKMLPPDLVLSPGKYEMKKRLQHLQMNSESVALLEQSIIRPEPRADEAHAEPTPEVMAAMMHTVEKGVPPQSTPDQVFNTLFVETVNERYIKLSPVTQGPLQDVVVPTEIPVDIHKEVITDEMEKLTEKLQNIPTAAELPPLDIFDTVMSADKKSPSKDRSKQISFQPITDEKSLWVNANLEHLVNTVGAAPTEVLDPANVDELETSGKLEEQMAAGVEYYVDADPIQYLSRVQLRGSQLPSFFPGYIYALPEFPGIVNVASSPDEVFASAWKSAQPKYFPDESMQSLIY